MAKIPHRVTFETMRQIDVPQSRNGKHRKIVTAVLAECNRTSPGQAIRYPSKLWVIPRRMSALPLSRESKKRKLAISTAADGDYLYLWREPE